MRLHLALLVLALLVLALPALAAPRPLPDPTFRDLDSHKQKLSSLHGTAVVLSFWATWCVPCQQELPRLDHLSAVYAGKPIRFLALSIDDNKSRADLTRFLAAHDLHLTVWTGASTDTMADMGLTDIVPSTLILDSDGHPITRITGEATEVDIRSRLDWLLNNRPDPAPAPTLQRTSLAH